MSSETIRNPQTDHLLTPDNAAFIIIDYQPVQVSSIRSMPRDELVFNIVSAAKAALNYNLPIIHSTVNVQTGRNKPPIQELQDVLGHLPTYDRTSINSWEDNLAAPSAASNHLTRICASRKCSRHDQRADWRKGPRPAAFSPRGSALAPDLPANLFHELPGEESTAFRHQLVK
ncbi:hypothetical protein [Roseomonas xinghualingensis]|uniref:hypothetical protein n=1 Tax=Roseomonas xinghualingensis TaxID=2986475 RepID=UPI00366F363C